MTLLGTLGRRLGAIGPLARRFYGEYRRVNLSFMASSIAYQAFVSLLPLFVSIFLLVAVVGGRGFATTVLATTESALPAAAHQLLAGAIQSEISSTATSAVSLLVLLWGSLELFRSLKTAFATIYGTQSTNSLVRQLRYALVAYLLLLAAIVAAVAATSLSIRSGLPFVDALSVVALFGGLTAVFLPIYYLFPDVPMSTRGALPGAVVAAVGATLLQRLFQFYIQYAADPNVAGALGAILVLLVWLYIGSYVVLLGAVVNHALRGEPAA
ncbi:YihY/virulence factor BrkB family protein [Halohasta salina]|uniref:YihY/virulence factor BrkB family protein n=1 Tax=Halohasta salina TaxID=2961621 RepID=UPI0020A47A9B|nr:YhjD/YihY/BrkB family envelope integrity protein [Halohasta salina]